MAGRDPVLHALVVADNVVPDPNTGKNYILGTITRLFVRQVPARINQICLYLCVGDAQDCRETTIEIIHLKEEHVLIRKKLPPLPGKKAKEMLELSIGLTGILFPEYGNYEFRVWMDGKYVGGRKFMVSPWPEQRS